MSRSLAGRALGGRPLASRHLGSDRNVIATQGARAPLSLQAQALFARMTTPPSLATQRVLDANFIAPMYAAGIMQKGDGLYFPAVLGNLQAATRNWVADQYNATAVGSPSFTLGKGLSGSTGNYFDTGFNPVTAGSPKFTRDNASMAIYGLTPNSGNGPHDLGNTNSNIEYGAAYRLNTSSNTTGQADSFYYQGPGGWSRTGPNSWFDQWQQRQVRSGTDASAALTSANFRLAETPDKVAFAWFGASLTRSEMTALLSAAHTCLNLLGLTTFYVTTAVPVNIANVSYAVHNCSATYSLVCPTGKEHDYMQFTLKEGDVANVGAERTEIKGPDRAFGSEFWNKFAIRYDTAIGTTVADSGDGATFTVTGQWHGAGNRPPYIGLYPYDNGAGGIGLKITLRWWDGAAVQSATAYDNANFADIGQWRNIVIDHKSHATTGICKVWVDGTLAVNYAGPLGFSDELPGQYFKMGIYRASRPGVMTTSYANVLENGTDLTAYVTAPEPLLLS